MAYTPDTSRKAVHLMHGKLLQGTPTPLTYAAFLADVDFVALISVEAERVEIIKARNLKEWDFLGSFDNGGTPSHVRLRVRDVSFVGSTKS